MEATAHLPGCNLKHTARQRCSSWTPPPPVEPPPPAEPPPTVPPKARSDSHWLLFAVFAVVTAVLWVPGFIIGGMTFLFIGFWALDRVGVVDSGDPNYIREARPESATLVKREEILGNGVVDGVVFWFYANDAPFSDIEQHYDAEFTQAGLERTTMWRPWNTDEPGIAFQDPVDHQRCIRLVRFTPEYDLQDFSYMGVDISALRETMLASPESYVVQFSTGCGG